MTKKHSLSNISYRTNRRKLRRKKLEFFLFQFGSGSTFPGSGSADLDSHENEVDPQHCLKKTINKVVATYRIYQCTYYVLKLESENFCPNAYLTLRLKAIWEDITLPCYPCCIMSVIMSVLTKSNYFRDKSGRESSYGV